MRPSGGGEGPVLKARAGVASFCSQRGAGIPGATLGQLGFERFLAIGSLKH